MPRILITGGAGYLGRALVEYMATGANVKFCIYSRDESKHVYMRRWLDQRKVQANCEYVLGDVRDDVRLGATFQSFMPDTVLHLAALKYVPQSEHNVAEAITVNIVGSQIVARLAAGYGAERVVAISTDKACRPTSVYGATKMLMERDWQQAASWGDTRFNLVRYGNVVASTGSVVSLFRQQAANGTIWVTNPKMTRYWLTVEDSIALVMAALNEQQSGTILVPHPLSMSMDQVALACAEMYGAPGHRIEIKRVGQRSGEKVHEDLVSPEESVYTVPNPSGRGWIIFPCTGTIKGHRWGGLNSDKATRLTLEEFQAMVRKAEGKVDLE